MAVKQSGVVVNYTTTAVLHVCLPSRPWAQSGLQTSHVACAESVAPGNHLQLTLQPIREKRKWKSRLFLVWSSKIWPDRGELTVASCRMLSHSFSVITPSSTTRLVPFMRSSSMVMVTPTWGTGPPADTGNRGGFMGQGNECHPRAVLKSLTCIKSAGVHFVLLHAVF